LVHCDTAVPAGDNLVIGTVSGDPTIVVRDIQDPANAKNLCHFDAGATSPQFVSSTQVAYETGSNQLIKVDLANGSTTLLAGSGASGSRQFAVSPDSRSITYLDGNAWHLVTPSGDRVLTTLPPVPGRGVNPDEDDSFLSFSPDGLYIALVQTFHVGGTGATAPDQVRKATDGSLVYSTSGMTMGVWASVPSRLFFRDSAGTVHRWDPSSGLSSMLPLHWIQPRSSPDGRWIAYTFRTSSGLGGIGLYSVQANSVSNTTPPGRSQARFLSNDLVWYIGERACSTCLGGQPAPTGVTFIYEIAGAAEVVSRLSGVLDAWPHSTPPGL
jgi:WD40-like Beta Propeller Repeat